LCLSTDVAYLLCSDSNASVAIRKRAGYVRI